MQNSDLASPFRLIPLDNDRQPQSSESTWTSREEIKHAVFARHFQEELPEGWKRTIKEWEFYRHLSLFVQSKTPNQCRIFHRKIIKKYESLQNFLLRVHKRIRSFEEWCDLYEPRLKVMESNIKRQRNLNFPPDQIQIPASKPQEEPKLKEEFKTDATYPDEAPIVVPKPLFEEKKLPFMFPKVTGGGFSEYKE